MADADDVRHLALALPYVAEIKSDIFFTTPEYDGSPLVMLRLAEVDVERLGELVIDAWRMRAPGHRADWPGLGGGPLPDA